MKSFRLVPASFIALFISIGVTAGSVYVTVDAAFRRTATEPVEVPVMVAGIADDASISEVPLGAGGILNARFSAISMPSGALLPSAGLDVALIPVNGRRIPGTTDADGICQFSDLSPGLYTITAHGVQGRISYGVRLTATDQPLARLGTSKQWSPVSVGLDVVLDSALTPARDSEAIDRIISSVKVTPIPRAAGTVAREEIRTLPAQFDDPQEESTYLGHEPVQLNGNGSLDGQIVMLNPKSGQAAPVSDLTVSFVADNTVVAQTRVNPDGSFVQANLLPGVYSMVIAGKDGIGYIGVDVVGGFAAADEERSENVIPVRMEARAGLSFGMLQGAGASSPGGESDGETDDSDDSEDTSESESDTSDDPSGQSPAAAGPGGTGTGASISGGGGTGSDDGIGAALGLAGGAAAAILAADDDDGRPASPAK